jgi:NADH-quinone oxidoreductase subunit N
MPEISAMNFLQLAPFLAMLLLMAVLLATNLISRGEIRKKHLWISASGLAIIALGTLLFIRTLTQSAPIWGGLLRMDLTTLSMLVLISAGAAITAAFAADEPDLVSHGEFSILLVAATLGLSLMTAANDLIMLYLAMEMAAIPLYVLAGFLVYDSLSTEAGLKYLLYGAVASAVMVYGFSWVFGISGSTNFMDISSALVNNAPIVPLLVAAVLILVGFGYKIAAVPFHFWAPDVYHGAPSAISGFLATASKTAGIVVLLRFLPILWPNQHAPLQWILAGMAILSMLAGNLLAMQQTNIKRLLAYSSIAHAGYLLIGVAAATSESTTGIYYYQLLRT